MAMSLKTPNKTHEIINKKMAPPFYDITLNSNKMHEFINLLWNSQKVNKMIVIIEQKMAPPFYDIILNSNKMNGFIR